MAKHKYKIGKLTINGEEYPACVNLRVMQKLEDEGIGFDDAFNGAHRWSNLGYIITCALEEGARLSGAEAPLTEDEIGDMIDITDLEDISEQLAALLGKSSRTVEAEPPKN